MNRPPRTSPVWILGGAVVSGASTYALLVVVGRALDPAAYGRFSLFWSGIVITSLGAFLPVEQVLARRTVQSAPGPDGRSPLLGRGIRLSAVVGVLAVLVFAAVWAVQDHDAARALLVVAAFAVACVGFALQFPARGVLAGRHELLGYAVVVGVDAVVRLAAAGALWAAGVRAAEAYVVVVASSAFLCGVVGTVLARRRSAVPGTAGAAGAPTLLHRALAADVAGLVAAMLCMQLLLNSPVVVAGTAGDAAAQVAAGHMLALLTLVRVPVFLAQSAQGGYVARAAAHAHHGRTTELRRLVAGIGAAVAVIGVVMVAAVAAIGPQVVRWVFGPEYVVGRGVATIAAVGVAAYLVASVANDLAVALGSRRSSAAWVVAAAAGALTLLVPAELGTRALLPLLAGSAVAACVMVPAVLRRVRPERGGV
ncbi:hypothetical protein [Cellulomonas sp. Marseille-Q8402]